MTPKEQYNQELYHYGVKGMKWGVQRAKRREAIGKYRKEYNDMTKNDSRLTKSVNKITGADKVYAVSKYTANKPTKTSGAGSAFAVSRKAAAAGRVAGMESKIANRNNGSKKTGFQRDIDSIKANIGARMKTVSDAKKTKYNAAKDEFRAERASVGKSRKIGHKLATNVLAGPFANRTYNSVLASGGSRTKAIGVTAATAIVGGPVGHIVISSLYTRDAADRKVNR